MMGLRERFTLLFVLVLQDGRVRSFAPLATPSDASLARRSALLTSCARRTHLSDTRTTAGLRCLSMSRAPDQPARCTTALWRPGKMAMATLLSAAVALTAVVPDWEASISATHVSGASSGSVPSWGVRPASAASFNDEQRAVAETWRTVDRLYVDRTFAGQDWFAVRQKALKEASKGLTESELTDALGKMLASLGDRYTRYLPPAKYETIVQASSGDVAGVGVSLSVDEARDLPLIVGVESGTPAAEAGLKEGDLLVQISGDECRGLTPDDAAALLRGTENTKVGIVAERPIRAAATGDAQQAEGAGKTSSAKGEKLDLIVTRRKFKVEGVVSKEATVNGRKLGVVRIKSFSSNTLNDVRTALEKFSAKGVDGVVVDLRGNVGGLLPGGIDTAGLFLDSGKDVVFIIRRNGSVEGRSTLAKGPNAEGPPLTILVDKGTASAAEVFAAGVRENERATLVGERTFGKGVIQTVEPLNSGGGVAVTVARYETPLHHNINKVGIPVDKEIDCPASRDAAECDL